MDITQVNTEKCKLDQYNDHEQIYLFDSLYRKYNGKPPRKQKQLKEKKEEQKEQGTDLEVITKKRGPTKGATKTPMDIKFKESVAKKEHIKIFKENCNGKTHEVLAKEYGISKYMVAKLIKQAKADRLVKCSNQVKQLEPEQKNEENVGEVTA
jgi:hypothetical protein